MTSAVRQRPAQALAAWCLAIAVVIAPLSLPPQGGATDELVTVIVRARSGSSAAMATAVDAVGGTIRDHLDLIDAAVAVLPSDAVQALEADPAVASVTPDQRLQLLHSNSADLALGPTSMTHIADTVRARSVWKSGVSGRGVDVAVIDSGVVPVNGLTSPGKVVNGPDLSFESGAEELRYLDTYGHGTHMAGIVAGRDDSVASPVRQAGHDEFVGIAPDARVVNLKVADSSGATDVSQVIAAMDWVVEHRRDNGLNIRVVNLSFGTDGIQDYRLDPLAHAVEEAWRRGLVVVVAAGNEGYGNAQLNNPAYDPFVLAVGGSDSRGTVGREDDVVAAWSSRGDAARRPDLVAPGQSVVSLRDAGSRIDQDHPGARVGERFFRGSGTSQAAAVVSGAAALLLQQRPALTPDQVKALLTSTATPLLQGDLVGQGAGIIDVAAAAAAPTPDASQPWMRSVGTGSLELARGSAHVTVDGTTVSGEQSVFFTAWDTYAWLTNLAAGTAWSSGDWSGNSWSGNSWSGGTWLGNSWSGNSWSGNSWSGNSWSGNSWSGNSWSGNSWSGNSWSGNSWSGNSWSSSSW